MNKYSISYADSKDKNELTLISESKVSIDGKEFEYDCKWLSPNVMILRINNKNYYISAVDNPDENFTEVSIDSIISRVICKSELDILKEKLSGNKSGDNVRNDIVSPMPGIIKKLNVKEGQEVKKGDVLLVLEAMKMENEIKAKKDSVIKKVCVEEMSSVEKNELLLMLG
ncbi:MAG: biotin/lipoyl-binding protein [Bacteroidetes bacterium]|nr:biotin/lipoyl-binding protein [Bacteroidota bacterium]